MNASVPITRHHRQRQRERRAGRDVAQRRAQGARLARHQLRLGELRGAIRASATNIAAKVNALSAKHGSTPTVAMITPAIAGPSMRAHCTITLFRRDRVDDPIGADHLDHEALARWVVDRVDAPRTKASAEDHPCLDAPVRASAKSTRAGTAMAICVAMQEAALVEAVGQNAGVGAEEEDRDELGRDDQADRHAAAGQLQDQPGLGDHLHPVAAQGDHLAGEVAAVVGHPQRGGTSGSARRSTLAVLEHALEHVRRALERGQVVGVEIAHAAREISVLAAAQPAQQVAALGVC